MTARKNPAACRSLVALAAMFACHHEPEELPAATTSAGGVEDAGSTEVDASTGTDMDGSSTGSPAPGVDGDVAGLSCGAADLFLTALKPDANCSKPGVPKGWKVATFGWPLNDSEWACYGRVSPEPGVEVGPADVAKMRATLAAGWAMEEECELAAPMADEPDATELSACVDRRLETLMHLPASAEGGMPVHGPDDPRSLYVIDIGPRDGMDLDCGGSDRDTHPCAVTAAAGYVETSGSNEESFGFDVKYMLAEQRTPGVMRTLVSQVIEQIKAAVDDHTCTPGEPWFIMVPLGWSSLQDGGGFKAIIERAGECGAVVAVSHGNDDATDCHPGMNQFPAQHASDFGFAWFISVGGIDLDGNPLPNSRDGAKLLAPGRFWTGPLAPWMGTSISVAFWVGALLRAARFTDDRGRLLEIAAPFAVAEPVTLDVGGILGELDQKVSFAEDFSLICDEQIVHQAHAVWEAGEAAEKPKTGSHTGYAVFDGSAMQLSLGCAGVHGETPIDGEDVDICLDDPDAGPTPGPRACTACATTNDKGEGQAAMHFDPTELSSVCAELGGQASLSLIVQVAGKAPNSTEFPISSDVCAAAAECSDSSCELRLLANFTMPKIEGTATAWLRYRGREQKDGIPVLDESLGHVVATSLKVSAKAAKVGVAAVCRDPSRNPNKIYANVGDEAGAVYPGVTRFYTYADLLVDKELAKALAKPRATAVGLGEDYATN